MNFAPPISTFARVDTSSSGARRATIDDLPSLQALWIEAGQPWEELEKLLAEFQVVADEDGSLLAAVGLLVEGTEGLLHTETVAVRAGEQADELRAQLWRRIQIVARNQGVVRLWTAEDAPYWATEFSVAPAATVAAAGAGFLGNDPTASWRVRELVDAAKVNRVIDEQMAIWATKRENDRALAMRKVKTWRAFAALLLVLFFVACLGALAIAKKAQQGRRDVPPSRRSF